MKSLKEKELIAKLAEYKPLAKKTEVAQGKKDSKEQEKSKNTHMEM